MMLKKISSLIPLLLLCLSLQACGGSPLKKINGSWVCDYAYTAKVLAGGVEVNAAALEQLSAAFKEITLSIDIEKKELIVAAGGQTKVSSFTVEEEKGDTVTLKADGKLIVVSLEKNDKGDEVLCFSVGSEPKVYFRPVK